MAKEIIKSVAEVKKVKPIIAYFLTEKNGGYEVHEAYIEEDLVLGTKRLGDADAWDQSILVLEAALSKQFQ
jgi:hypothetical protein